MAHRNRQNRKKRTDVLSGRDVCVLKNGRVISGYPFYAEYFIEEKAGSWLVYTEERGKRYARAHSVPKKLPRRMSGKS
ncbi:MAG: hypothetical protein J5722_00900 [Oscillospiraceae bacterium]|nr:hypothetical protein [Oscillospiraceae bacterium]